MNTKLLGVKIPFHTNFEEVNLRFYVKRKVKDEWRRGVVFIKEIVPRSAITFIANTVYKEKYETMKMGHRWEVYSDHQLVEYRWQKATNWNSLELKTNLESEPIPDHSKVEFITEHYWGYAKVNGQKTNEYEVTHPKWQHYPVQSYQIKADFGKVYGK